VVVTERHGHYREDVRTVCRDRDDWHRPHRRGYYRNTRYGHNDRWRSPEIYYMPKECL
jgi:hypothetical protein